MQACHGQHTDLISLLLNPQHNSLISSWFVAVLLVSFLMDCKKSLAYKIMVTYITLVGPLPSVKAFVYGQCRALSECLLTHVTFVRPFSCVCALMLFEVPALDESLPTHITSIRPVPCVYLTVVLEVNLISE
jgi:hypothetical protein